MCDGLLCSFSGYDTERPEFGARQAKPTFDRWKNFVNLTMAREALSAIRDKASATLTN